MVHPHCCQGMNDCEPWRRVLSSDTDEVLPKVSKMLCLLDAEHCLSRGERTWHTASPWRELFSLKRDKASQKLAWSLVSEGCSLLEKWTDGDWTLGLEFGEESNWCTEIAKGCVFWADRWQRRHFSEESAIKRAASLSLLWCFLSVCCVLLAEPCVKPP